MSEWWNKNEILLPEPETREWIIGQEVLFSRNVSLQVDYFAWSSTTFMLCHVIITWSATFTLLSLTSIHHSRMAVSDHLRNTTTLLQDKAELMRNPWFLLVSSLTHFTTKTLFNSWRCTVCINHFSASILHFLLLFLLSCFLTSLFRLLFLAL